MYKIGIIAFVWLAMMSTGKAQTINAEKSKVTFEIGNMEVRTVEGSFNGMTGTVVFKPKELDKSSFNVCIDASTINTDDKKRDVHLRSADFFHVEKYPEICFKSESVVIDGGVYKTRGKLTIHGVTKDVEIIFGYKDNVLLGNLTLNRLDYNIGKETNTFMVSDEVKLTIICHLNF
ncbi:MAG: YceI family protein [Saprospiraceae bacterium]|nr:YceI family protein [Saprospiraceae bacterium]